jgi:hypothetical protein
MVGAQQSFEACKDLCIYRHGLAQEQQWAGRVPGRFGVAQVAGDHPYRGRPGTLTVGDGQ